MPQFSNSDKQEHGKNAKAALESILHECKNYAYIKEIVGDYNNVVGLPVGRLWQELKKEMKGIR